MSENKWQLFPQRDEICNKISNRLKINPIIAQILLNRQITSTESLNSFLFPQDSLDITFDHELLAKAAKILSEFQKEKKKILIYGDYDADGITATVAIATKSNCFEQSYASS
ncbi:hypothetical protein ACFL2K_05130 [Candidatus Margulisiibacteriota bacterium]